MGYANKEDQAKAARRHYESNKAVMKARARIAKKLQAVKMLAYVNSLKEAPCTDCGLRFHPFVMDFDHIGDDKHKNVSTMVQNGSSLQAIQKEIDKCELVCSNCHRMRTWNRKQLRCNSVW